MMLTSHPCGSQWRQMQRQMLQLCMCILCTVVVLEKEAAAIRSEFCSDSIIAQKRIRLLELLYGTKHTLLGLFLHQLASLAGLSPRNTSRTRRHRLQML